MNQELRDSLNIEIANAPQEMRDFLNDQYFHDTVSLIERVNKFTAEQAVSLELEVTMFLLGISDYPSIEEALRGELGQGGQVANEATVRQAVKDVDAYILSKAPKVDMSVKKVEVSPSPEATADQSKKDEGKLHDILYKELDINKKEEVLKAENTEPAPAATVTPTPPVEPAKPLDFYREKVGDEEKKVKSL